MTPAGDIDLLLVEDNPHDVELILRALERSSITNKVWVTRDGAEALDFVFGAGAYAHRRTERPPKVVVLDLKLPKVDGLEVLRRLRSDERTRLIPVVVLTSSQEERDIVESYRRGVNSYLVKAVDYGDFAQCVSELGFYWLARNRAPR